VIGDEGYLKEPQARVPLGVLFCGKWNFPALAESSNAEDERARTSLLHVAQVSFRLTEERVDETDERQSATS
jgi:hypothetical protein